MLDIGCCSPFAPKFETEPLGYQPLVGLSETRMGPDWWLRMACGMESGYFRCCCIALLVSKTKVRVDIGHRKAHC